jgi:hypothetical protein
MNLSHCRRIVIVILAIAYEQVANVRSFALVQHQAFLYLDYVGHDQNLLDHIRDCLRRDWRA